MNRRRFIYTSALGLGSLHLASSLPASTLGAEGSYDLAIVKGEEIAPLVRAAVEALGGMKRFVKQGNTVLLKPNVSFPNPPEWGSTTHPAVIAATAALCLEAGAKRVIAVDFPMGRAAQCFERSGLNQLVQSTKDFTFMELKDEAQFETVPVPDGQEVKEIAIAKILRKVDVFINLPAAKAHSATGVSFGLKNLMGLFWNRYPFHKTYDLHNAIVDLALVMKPQLTIMDAVYALITNGPQGPGKTERLNTVIAGGDPLAVDVATCGLAEWNNRATTPRSVRHLERAIERGLGADNLDKLNVYRNA